jgi:hypothetical protein
MKNLAGGARTKQIMPFALAAIAVLCIPGRAWAPTAVEYAIAGMWHGFFLSSLTGESGPFTINNTDQRNRRFGGTLDVGNLMIPYEGTLAASGRFTVVGRGSDGKFEVNHGELMVNGDGTAFAQSDFKLRTAGGMPDTGSLIFLQDFKATHPPQLSQVHDWMGPVVSSDGKPLGMVEVMLSPPDPTRDTLPSFFMGQASLGDMTFPFEVTISDRDAEGASLVHALGRNAGVMFLVNGRFMGESIFEWCINATFSATYADGSVLQGSFNLTPVD